MTMTFTKSKTENNKLLLNLGTKVPKYKILLNSLPINWHDQAFSQEVSFMANQILNFSFLPGITLKR